MRLTDSVELGDTETVSAVSNTVLMDCHYYAAKRMVLDDVIV